MIREARPLAEITTEAIRILYREIGVVDTLRFISQYTAGYGDYTAQREELFAGMPLDRIVSEIKERRKHGRPGHRKKSPYKRTASRKQTRKARIGRKQST
jgi:hypothetical protein